MLSLHSTTSSRAHTVAGCCESFKGHSSQRWHRTKAHFSVLCGVEWKLSKVSFIQRLHMPWELYWASSRTRRTGGVMKRTFFTTGTIQSHREATPTRLPPLSLSLSLTLSLSLSLPLSSLVAAHRLRLMAGSTAKSSQCDKVIWSHRGSETESGEKSAVSVRPYTLITRRWGNGLKIKTNGERWMISQRPDCWLQCLQSYPDGYEARMTVGAETYCCPLDRPSRCHAW